MVITLPVVRSTFLIWVGSLPSLAGAMAVLLAAALSTPPPPPLLSVRPLTFGSRLSSTLPPSTFHDYSITALSDDYNLLFRVNATSDYANALGLYVYESLPPQEDRLTPGQYLDLDAFSMIVVDGVRQYSVVLAPCYIRPGQTYYLSVFGKNVWSGSNKPSVSYTVEATKIPARIPLNSTITGTIDSTPESGGVRTHVTKTDGDLDYMYMRYEQCAGLASANLASADMSGHGMPSGSVVLPKGFQPLEAGRYYVSMKAQPEICGDYKISVEKISQIELLSSPAITWRSGSLLSLITSFASALLLGRSAR
ncbi:MAG: hypothetical protein SGPRY_009389 [Prymnesium sp.]